MQPEYVLELELSAAVEIASCYHREYLRRRVDFVLDVQMAVGSLLVSKSGIKEYLEDILKQVEG